MVASHGYLKYECAFDVCQSIQVIAVSKGGKMAHNHSIMRTSNVCTTHLSHFNLQITHTNNAINAVAIHIIYMVIQNGT